METLAMKVTNDLSVTIIPDTKHEFIMPTKEVAHGYGVHHSTLRRHYQNHDDELIEGKHYLSNVQILHTASKGASRTIMWTKRGIVRLGFFIKSPQAKLFRDWAEDLVINKLDEAKRSAATKALPRQRQPNHNRLTPNRMLDIMSDICLIQDHDLRTRIATKLMGNNN